MRALPPSEWRPRRKHFIVMKLPTKENKELSNN